MVTDQRTEKSIQIRQLAEKRLSPLGDLERKAPHRLSSNVDVK
jgi:hypothetical protein